MIPSNSTALYLSVLLIGVGLHIIKQSTLLVRPLPFGNSNSAYIVSISIRHIDLTEIPRGEIQMLCENSSHGPWSKKDLGKKPMPLAIRII